VRGPMAPPPGRRFPYRDGVQPALQRVHLSKGRGLPQPARAEPVPGRRPLDAARYPVRAGMRVFRKLSGYHRHLEYDHALQQDAPLCNIVPAVRLYHVSDKSAR
jgi:hypothetical protein